MGLVKLQKQVAAVIRCQENLDAANVELKRLSGRKLHFETVKEYNDAVSMAEDNVRVAEVTLENQIRMNAYNNGFTKEMEAVS